MSYIVEESLYRVEAPIYSQNRRYIPNCGRYIKKVADIQKRS